MHPTPIDLGSNFSDMKLSKKEIVERYPDGKISYIETRAVIAPLWAGEYPNRRVSTDGIMWIRVGVNKKYNPDGSLRWEIKYDNYGKMVK
ncbi:hypothetical protein LCGC14_0388290 [marine sediment metagenome]|uniref:Uncharacterized protein n=1 Tax=marine sediment metagenome TaxID=412755 RepID=A0A0F9TIA4_9ZZZZ